MSANGSQACLWSDRTHQFCSDTGAFDVAYNDGELYVLDGASFDIPEPMTAGLYSAAQQGILGADGVATLAITEVVTPEPASLALFGLTLLGVAALRRGKR